MGHYFVTYSCQLETLVVVYPYIMSRQIYLACVSPCQNVHMFLAVLRQWSVLEIIHCVTISSYYQDT